MGTKSRETIFGSSMRLSAERASAAGSALAQLLRTQPDLDQAADGFQRDSAATFSAHASMLVVNLAGSQMPRNGSRPLVAGWPLFVFAFIDLFILTTRQFV